MSQPAYKYYSVEEYLALEEDALEKHEYYRGQIYQMAGASFNHDRIVVESILALTEGLRDRPCEVFSSDVKIKVAESGLFTYPDASVMCGELELYRNRRDIYTNPLVIIEVLSDKTREYDRTEKFEHYKTLVSLQDYILIEQNRPYVECFSRTAQGWLHASYNGLEQTLLIPSLELSIPLSQIYRRVTFPDNISFHPSLLPDNE